MTVVAIVTSMTFPADQCDLNEDKCFALADKTNWTINYVTSKQEYIELISQGKSWVSNPYREKPGLTRRNGIKVGHVEKIEFKDGSKVNVITRAMRPLLFEIPNFLSSEECDHIIKRALDPDEGGMFESKAKGGLTPLDTFKPTGKKGRSLGIFGRFLAWDKNGDGKINIDEIIQFIHSQKWIILLEKDVYDMFKALEMNPDILSDGYIDHMEFDALDQLGMEEYAEVIARENPRFKHRYSNQAWLYMEQWIDPTVYNIREKLVQLTGLGREIIYGGERLQVVHYKPFGHYHAHMDTETHKEWHIPCCHQQFSDMATTSGKCRICRFLTFLMYLNDVEEGGETAFPVADGRPMTEMERDDFARGNSKTDRVNLSHGCHRANLVLKPKKGTAILWYNHYVNTTDNWMGEMDLHSLHGGCDVKKGEKWLSNLWIPAPYGRNTKSPSEYLNWRDLHLAESKARGLTVKLFH